MLGFLIGTACLIGLFKVLRAGRGCGPAFAYGGHGHDHGFGAGACGGGGCGPRGDRWRGHWGGAGSRRGGGFGRARLLRGLFERLGTTPGQEKVIVQALDELRDVAKRQREELEKARADVAAALRAETFDESAAARASVGLEEATRSVKEATLAALRKTHEALTDEQRKALADIVERGPRGFAGPWRGWGGPYRGGPGAWA
jgi:Spy/CpxP family protein refolding chaperone